MVAASSAIFNIVIATVMVSTGTINTLAAKWADLLPSRGTNPHPPHLFIHPYLQAAMMFLGEMSCYIVFKIWFYSKVCRNKDISSFGPQKFNPLVWAIPAMCDLLGTSTMYVGLTWTYAASFQMLRGSVIIFTGLLSVAFLGNKLHVHQWVGMFTVVAGLVLVGIGDYLYFNGSGGLEKSTVVAGDLLIVLAQVIAAIQMTVEEKIIKKYRVPALQGVGWEGIFGFSVLFILLFPMFFIPWHLPASQDFWQDTVRFEDSIDGLTQIINSAPLLVATLGLIVSIAFFNFSGLTVTKTMSATTRMVLDSVRTIFIWAFSLAVGWQNFEPLQPVGYIVLFTGTCIYYNLIIWPSICWVVKRCAPDLYARHFPEEDPDEKNPEKQPLLANSSPAHDAFLDKPAYSINRD